MRRGTALCVLLSLRAASPEGLRGAGRADSRARRWLGGWADPPWAAPWAAPWARRLLPWYMYDECLDLIANDDAVLATRGAYVVCESAAGPSAEEVALRRVFRGENASCAVSDATALSSAAAVPPATTLCACYAACAATDGCEYVTWRGLADGDFSFAPPPSPIPTPAPAPRPPPSGDGTEPPSAAPSPAPTFTRGRCALLSSCVREEGGGGDDDGDDGSVAYDGHGEGPHRWKTADIY